MARRGRPRQEIRDGHKWCVYHKAWEKIDQFDTANASTGALHPSCQVARMAMRDAKIEAEPEYFDTDTCIDPDLDKAARRFVESRASDVVRRLRYCGVKVDRSFVMVELNYDALVPEVRALIGPDGICAWCGKPFTEKHPVSFDHIEPPRWNGEIDWERLHASNIRPMHRGENGSKGEKPYATALRDNMQRWMAERKWANQAGRPGWPTLQAMQLPDPEPDPEPEPDKPVVGQISIFDLISESAA